MWSKNGLPRTYLQTLILLNFCFQMPINKAQHEFRHRSRKDHNVCLAQTIPFFHVGISGGPNEVLSAAINKIRRTITPCAATMRRMRKLTNDSIFQKLYEHEKSWQNILSVGPTSMMDRQRTKLGDVLLRGIDALDPPLWVALFRGLPGRVRSLMRTNGDFSVYKWLFRFI